MALEFEIEDAPKQVVRPHKYDAVIAALIDAGEGKQIAAYFEDEKAAESYLTAIRTLARRAGYSAKQTERAATEKGIKIGVSLVAKRTRRSSEEVAAERAAAAVAEAEGKGKSKK